jgi:hypothetical protein
MSNESGSFGCGSLGTPTNSPVSDGGTMACTRHWRQGKHPNVSRPKQASHAATKSAPPVEEKSAQPVEGKKKPQLQYTLIIAINPSATTKSGAVDTTKNPGHTIVALKDSQGKLEKVFSFGPQSHFPISCSCPATSNYRLEMKDTYTTFEFAITDEQHKNALDKIKQIEASPGTFDAEDQCTSKSLDIVRAAGLTVPNGEGKVYVPFCSVPGKVPTPVDLDQALLKDYPDAGTVPALYFKGFVPVK